MLVVVLAFVFMLVLFCVLWMGLMRSLMLRR